MTVGRVERPIWQGWGTRAWAPITPLVSDDARDADGNADPGGDGAVPDQTRKLRVVTFQTAPRPDERVAAGLHLVREYKGPTVAGVLRASPGVVNRLPGRVHTMLEAIERGDLPEAQRRLDAAVRILPGPGSRRRLPILWPWFVGMWIVAAIATLVALWTP